MSSDIHKSIRELAINLWDGRERMTFLELADELGIVHGMQVVR